MFAGANVAYSAPATLSDGSPAVLKINFPDVESEREAEALAHWQGQGAVRLLRHDAARRALVVERCLPGTELWQVADEAEANRLAAAVLARLWRPAPRRHDFRLLANAAAQWAATLPANWDALGRPFERKLLEAAVTALRELGPAQGEQVVVHQDFHGGNVLRAEREPWLVIDPKPLVGEREFDTASLLRDRRDELERDRAPQRRLRRRLDQLSADLRLDRERMRGWAVAHTLAWGCSGTRLYEDHVAVARLLLNA
jgi:streptomycin 6-kinase